MFISSDQFNQLMMIYRKILKIKETSTENQLFICKSMCSQTTSIRIFHGSIPSIPHGLPCCNWGGSPSTDNLVDRCEYWQTWNTLTNHHVFLRKNHREDIKCIHSMIDFPIFIEFSCLITFVSNFHVSFVYISCQFLDLPGMPDLHCSSSSCSHASNVWQRRSCWRTWRRSWMGT